MCRFAASLYSLRDLYYFIARIVSTRRLKAQCNSRMKFYSNFKYFLFNLESIMSSKYVVSVDVGTSSVRAALVNLCGKIIKKAVHKIHTWNPEPEHYEQSSEDIWNAVCFCVRV